MSKAPTDGEATANLVSLSPSSFARSLGIVAFALVLASVAGQTAARLIPNVYVYRASLMFNVDLEGNFPAAFSSLLLLLAALLLAVISVLESARAASAVRHWAMLSSGFFFMAFDEAFGFHEKLIPVMQDWLGGDQFGMFYFAWVVPGIALVVVLAIAYARFLARLSTQTRTSFLIAAAIYLGGAIGAELIGGLLLEQYGVRSIVYKLATTIEEGLEMSGAIVFIWALMVYLATNYREVRFRFADGAGPFEDHT
jgi:hypothetical protein